MYTEKAVTTLRVIKAAQNLGFTLDDVADLLEAGRHHHGTGGGLQSRTGAKLAEVDQKIADLPVIRASLIAARDAGPPLGTVGTVGTLILVRTMRSTGASRSNRATSTEPSYM